FAPAAAVHTLNLAVIAALMTGHIESDRWALFIECLHYNAWILSIYLTLKATADQKALPQSLRVLFILGWPLTLAVLIAGVLELEMHQVGPWMTLTLAVISLVSVEQLFRYAASNDRQIKLLCMNLAALFLFDIYLY